MTSRIPALPMLLSLLALAGGCRTETVPGPEALFEVRAGALGERPGWLETELVSGGARVWMADAAAVDATMVASAEVSLDASGRPAVLVALDESGEAAMARLSAEQLSRPVVLVVDGRPTSAPIVMSPLGGRLLISAEGLTRDDAEDLARRLSADRSTS